MTGSVTLRFYEELNDFLSPARRKRDFDLAVNGRSSVKDLIESAGVPHTEIDLILANGDSVDFSYIVQPGDRISVYPVFEALDISSLNLLRPKPLREPRFVLDTHLGKLSRYLRLLGFDCLYSNAYGDAELAEISATGGKRILLTRDQGLLKYKKITHGYFIRHTDPERQLREVLRRFDLRNNAQPFSRCIRCNGPLTDAEPADVRGRVPGPVAERFDHFTECRTCERVYWPGSHYSRLTRIVERLLKD
ncbi:MAG: Mut7-C ubiquitin/RNAse domain-containing protein [Gammaproteobacteria bacterium]|nr:Mut7-C ubiquitin/RNAse domain-containing protein [Gammaproteobacteria bacterium]